MFPGLESSQKPSPSCLSTSPQRSLTLLWSFLSKQTLSQNVWIHLKVVNLALYKRKIWVVFLDVLVYNYFLSHLTDNSMYISYYIRLMYEETLSFIFMLKNKTQLFIMSEVSCLISHACGMMSFGQMETPANRPETPQAEFSGGQFTSARVFYPTNQQTKRFLRTLRTNVKQIYDDKSLFLLKPQFQPTIHN